MDRLFEMAIDVWNELNEKKDNIHVEYKDINRNGYVNIEIKNGKILYNIKIKYSLNFEQKYYVLLHELGHVYFIERDYKFFDGDLEEYKKFILTPFTNFLQDIEIEYELERRIGKNKLKKLEENL